MSLGAGALVAGLLGSTCDEKQMQYTQLAVAWHVIPRSSLCLKLLLPVCATSGCWSMCALDEAAPPRGSPTFSGTNTADNHNSPRNIVVRNTRGTEGMGLITGNRRRGHPPGGMGG